MIAHDAEYRDYQTIQEWSDELYDLEVESTTTKWKNGEAHQITYGWGFLGITLIGMCLLATVAAFYRKRFTLLVDVLFNWKLSKQVIRYEKVHSHPVNILLMITFLLFFPLFYSLSLSILRPELEFAFLIKAISLFIVIYLIAKLILYQFTAWLFDEGKLFNQYIFQVNLFSKFMGVLLLFLWILLVYSPFSPLLIFRLSLFFLLLFLALQTIRAVAIGRSEGKDLLLIILYLCTLEILPWLLLYKSFENHLE